MRIPTSLKRLLSPRDPASQTARSPIAVRSATHESTPPPTLNLDALAGELNRRTGRSTADWLALLSGWVFAIRRHVIETVESNPIFTSAIRDRKGGVSLNSICLPKEEEAVGRRTRGRLASILDLDWHDVELRLRLLAEVLNTSGRSSVEIEDLGTISWRQDRFDLVLDRSFLDQTVDIAVELLDIDRCQEPAADSPG